MLTMMLMYVGMGLLLTLVALPLYFQKIPPNGLYGFRVRKTMANKDIWYAVNKYSSRWLIATGLGTVLIAVVLYLLPGISLDGYALACLGLFTVVLATGIITSVRYMNSL
jgi:uncharacterized membrane protein